MCAAFVTKPYLIINDVSESKRHLPAINSFLRLSRKHGMLADRSISVIPASALRKKVFAHLKRDTEKSGKYDLILLGDRGGTLLFSGSELRGFGTAVRRLPYSMHMKKDFDLAGTIPKEVSSLGGRPRILILEGDAGISGATGLKLEDARKEILLRRGDADVRIVIGAAHRDVTKDVSADYIGRRTPKNPKRLSETIEAVEQRIRGHKELAGMGLEKKMGLSRLEGALKRMQELRKARGMTGTLPH